MRAFLFFAGFIWVVGGGVSIILGPFIGLHGEARKRMRSDFMKFWAKNELLTLRGIVIRGLCLIAFVGFLFPILFPFVAIPFGLVYFSLM